jgi:hypothetical protein
MLGRRAAVTGIRVAAGPHGAIDASLCFCHDHRNRNRNGAFLPGGDHAGGT